MAGLNTEHRTALAAGLAWWLLLLWAAWTYWPGLDGPSLLDDEVNLSPLQVLHAHPEYFWDVIAENTSGPLGRPMSMFTFGLEYLAGWGDIRTTKYHNLLLHLLNGCLVFWVVCLLTCRFEKQWAAPIAAITAAYWLLNPLFVSTTLYMVQRMTLLSALGVLAGCLVYIKARTALPIRSPRFLAAMLGWTACLAFAAFSKENGLLLVPITLVLEFALFRWRNPDGRPDPAFRAGTLAIAAAGILAVLWYLYASIVMGDNYSRRDFTLGERLLSQPRFLWTYIGHYFLPIDPGLGIYHDDVVVSRGPWSPPGTLWAILAWIAVVGGAIWAVCRDRLLLIAAGVLVFLTGHLMESTFFPLELYFEHRNYLPGLGLALIAAGSLSLLLRNVHLSSPLIWAITSVALLAVSMPLARQTEVWSNAELFAVNAVNQHPESERANLEWALLLAKRQMVEMAIYYADRATLNTTPDDEQRNLVSTLHRLIMHCAANRMPPSHLFDQLIQSWTTNRPSKANQSFETLITQTVRGHCDAQFGLAVADAAWQIGGNAPLDAFERRTLGKLARLENKLKRYNKALAYAEGFVEKKPGYPKGLLMVAYFSGNTGDWQKYSQTMDKIAILNEAGKLSVMDYNSYQALKRKEQEK